MYFLFLFERNAAESIGEVTTAYSETSDTECDFKKGIKRFVEFFLEARYIYTCVCVYACMCIKDDKVQGTSRLK